MKNLHSAFRLILFPIAASAAIMSFAFADDAADTKASAETTHDVSKNPLTGSTTETTTRETKMKVGDASRTTKRVHKRKLNRDRTKVKETNESTSEVN